MTKRQLEVAKKLIIAERNKLDREIRARRKVPRWREFACRHGWKKPRIVWIARWEAKHAATLKRATHNAIQIAKRGGV